MKEIVSEAPFRPATSNVERFRVEKPDHTMSVPKTEFQHEYDKEGGEIVSQVKANPSIAKKHQMPKPIERAMNKLSKSPGLVRQMMTGKNAGREIYSKDKIRKNKVMNTSGDQTWDQAKKDITPKRIAREIGRAHV